jgi:hypothetical protein
MTLKIWLTRLLAVCLMLPALAWSRVGEITLVVGQFEVQRTAGPSQLAKGDAVLEGDIIKTTANGHVHIRFIDGGLVSVRPNSVFTIHEFRFNPALPATSVVRLSLDRGEVRSISGQATQEAKDRFRLNTPLVAIGVKGTDFTTQAKPGITRVTVNQGAIVMAPFDQSCRADALGVCTGARAKDLSADMLGMALVYRSGAEDPSLQLISSQKESGKISQLDRQMRDNTERAAATSTVPDAPLPDTLIPAARLVWGRWTQVPAPGDALTVSFSQALQGNEVTVGDGYYFLFREPNVPNQLPSLGHQASFKLQNASAQYRTPANELVAAQVHNATLQVDFAQRSFATQLQVQANGIAPQNLQYSGIVDVQTGIFLSPAVSGQGRLAGALGLDGRQAGYFFNSPVGNGSVSGATLWAR